MWQELRGADGCLVRQKHLLLMCLTVWAWGMADCHCLSWHRKGSRLQTQREKPFPMAFWRLTLCCRTLNAMLCALPSSDLLFCLLTTKSGSFIPAVMFGLFFFPKLWHFPVWAYSCCIGQTCGIWTLWDSLHRACFAGDSWTITGPGWETLHALVFAFIFLPWLLWLFIFN